MKNGFNSSFVEIQTLEGEKFLRDLKPGDLVLTRDKTFDRIVSIEQRLAHSTEEVYNLYYHTDKEGVVDRISGEHVMANGIRVKNLRVSDRINHISGKTAIIDRIEKMDTINRFFYSIKLEKGSSYCVNNIFVKSI
jgi:hypothetical protein